MHPILRWLLFMPAAVAASIAAFFAFALLSYIVRVFNIVPQDSIIDLLLAIAGANFVAAAAGVCAGTFAAPKGQKYVAIILATLSASFAAAMAVLVFLNPENFSSSLFEATVGALAWVVGASLGAYGVIGALAEDDRCTNQRFSSDAG